MALPIINSDPTNYGNRPGDGPLRPNGTSIPDPAPQTEANLPSTLSPAAKKQQGALNLVRDLWAGAERVEAMGAAYLPQAPGEQAENYRSRLKRSVFYNVFGKTVEGLTGFIFRKDLKLGDDVPEPIRLHCENIDNSGTHLDVFARDLEQDAMVAGHAAIFVDYPNTGAANGVRLTLADEQPLRPYWIPIRKENILSWRTVVEHGRTIPSQVVLKECTMVADGEFGEKEQTRYRVLNRDAGVVSFRLLEITEKKTVNVVDFGTYPTQDEIPLVEVPTSGKRGLFESDPPLLDLAHLNIAHYQQWSDYATSIHMTNVPILAAFGDDSEGSLVVGPNSGYKNANPAGKLEYVSHDGAALQSSKAALDDLKLDMGTLGISMLASHKAAAETATAKRIDKATADSALSVTARALQDALERALAFHAKYMNLWSESNGGGSVQVNRDFEVGGMDPQMLSAYVQAVASAGMPVEILYTAMQVAGLISDNVDVDELTAQTMANQAAIDQAKQDQLAMAAQNAQKPPLKAA